MAEKVKLTFLGTGSAVPTARRNHPAVYLQFKDENILVDCGEGTQRQFRRAGLNPCKITKILITHWHGDHVLGLPGLLQTLMMNGYSRKLEIYGPIGTSERVRKFFDLIGRKGQEFDVRVSEFGGRGIGTSERIVDGEDFIVESFEVLHDCPCVGYNFVVKEKMRLDKEKLAKMKIPNSLLIGELAKGKSVDINGKKIDGKKLMYKEPGRKVSFVMDTRYDDSIVKSVKGVDLLVSEATFSSEERDVAYEYGHLTSVDAGKIAKKGKVKGLVLMHLSQRYDEIPKKILNEAKGVFENVRVVEDLDKIIL